MFCGGRKPFLQLLNPLFVLLRLGWTVGSTEETFPLLTLGLAGYGGESIRHQLKEDWRQT